MSGVTELGVCAGCGGPAQRHGDHWWHTYVKDAVRCAWRLAPRDRVFKEKVT